MKTPNLNKIKYAKPRDIISLYLVDRWVGVLHSNQQSSRVQDRIMMGTLQSLQPWVAPVIRHVHVRSKNRLRVSNIAWREGTGSDVKNNSADITEQIEGCLCVSLSYREPGWDPRRWTARAAARERSSSWLCCTRHICEACTVTSRRAALKTWNFATLHPQSNRSSSHSAWSVGGGLSIAVGVLGSAQWLPLGSLVIRDHCLYVTVCQNTKVPDQLYQTADTQPRK